MLMDELDFFVKVIVPIFSGFGVISLIWNVYNFYQAQKGFLKLRLECKCEHGQLDESYIICKTFLENTGRTSLQVIEANVFATMPPSEKVEFSEELLYYSDRVTKPGIYEVAFRVRGKKYSKRKIKANKLRAFLKYLPHSKEDLVTHTRTVKDSVLVQSPQPGLASK